MRLPLGRDLRMMSCGCRSGATCADHLEEADLTLQPVPFGGQVAADADPGSDEGESDDTDA